MERLLLLHHDTGSGAMTAGLHIIPWLFQKKVTLSLWASSTAACRGRIYPSDPGNNRTARCTIVELNYEGILAAEYPGRLAGPALLWAAGRPASRGKEILGGFELYRHFLTADYGEPAVWGPAGAAAPGLLQLWNKMESCKFWQWPRLARLMNTTSIPTLPGGTGPGASLFGGYPFSQVKTAVLPGKEEAINGYSLWADS